MKKIVALFLITIMGSNILPATAHTCRHYSHRTHSSSQSVYLIKKEQSEETTNFSNCDEHSLVTKTTINYYSDGTRRIFKSYKVLNKNGVEIITNCTNIHHIIYDKKHYFIAKQNKRYKIFDNNGKIISIREYTFMEELDTNRFLVRCNKKYGIINLEENLI